MNFELAHAVQNEASKMPPKDEKCEKHKVLSISASTWLKKVDDSCRAESQPISLFLPKFRRLARDKVYVHDQACVCADALRVRTGRGGLPSKCA